jgi:hypothetical protein
MSILFWAIGGFVAAMFLSEIALKGTKLQTGLAKVLAIHFVIAGFLIIYFALNHSLEWLAVLIFWAGAFLTWFGVRSHVESSILLRMLFLLRKGPLVQSRLIEDYESHYGQTQRVEELFRGGLLQRTSSEIIVTPKGKLILHIVSILK